MEVKGANLDVKVIAIAGGSCSGKTRLAEHTAMALGENACTIVRQDNYYLDYGGVNPDDPLPNFDHPNAFEWRLLRRHLLALKAGETVHIPNYDFVTHRRTDITHKVEPRPIIILEGILVLTQRVLHPVFDQSFFVKCVAEERLARRLKRDVAERGRTAQSVREQFTRDVEPMHDRFVEPSSAFADWVITQNQCSLEMIMNDGPVITWCKTALGA